MPSNLPEVKRIALEEFYAGRISAGELSKRLTVSSPTVPPPVPATETAPGPQPASQASA
jgi:hypothetical protein